MLAIIFRNFRLIRREEKGVVLILFVLLFVPLLLIIAVGIDFGQTLIVKRQLESGVDAAALALGAQPAITAQADLEAEAETYIKAHYPDSGIGDLKNFTVTRFSNDPRIFEVNVTATAEIQTTLMRIAGVDTLTVVVNSKVVRQEKDLEIVMVLDNSGSMGNGSSSKLQAMKDAANTLVSILFAGNATSDEVNIGLVPFTGAVFANVTGANLSLDLSNPAPIQTYLTLPAGESAFNVFEVMNGGIASNWGGCVRSRVSPHDTQDTPSTTAETLFSAFFKPNNRGDAKSFYQGLTAASKTTPPSTPPAPAPPVVSPNHTCPTAPVQPLINVSSTITNSINAMTGDGSTNIAEGLAWGLRVISESNPFNQGAPYTDQGTIKAIIVLTDGANEVAGADNYSSYGFGDSTNPQLGPNVNATVDAKTTEVCNNIKADKDGDSGDEDILLYAITFAVSSPAIINLMQNCATDSAKFFNSPSGADLQGAFQSIAASLRQLRIAE